MKRLLRLLLPAGLRGQVAVILLLGLLLSQLMVAVMYLALSPAWQRELRPELAVSKVSMVVRLLEAVPRRQRAGFTTLWNEDSFKAHYSDADVPAPACNPGNPGLEAQLAAALSRPRGSLKACPPASGSGDDDTLIHVQLRGGGQLEVLTPIGLQSRVGLLEQVATGAFLVFATGGLWVLLTWTVNRPLTRFARAAERVGLDVNTQPLPEQGPAQLRRAIHAFNEMQERLQRMLRDRTLMLGAISHDLGTPLTRLRLRVETGRVADNQAKMLEDIETLQAMLASALAFVRGVDDAEPSTVVDLDSLLQTCCDLVSDLGGDVDYGAPARSLYHCRPQAMLRALTNVVSNAAKYGGRAQVSLQKLPGRGYRIEVEDDGPGIADADKARVFEPFYRTSEARESEKQGMGLGLSIARSVILAHGGSIELADRLPCGLKVSIFLPEPGSTPASAPHPATFL